VITSPGDGAISRFGGLARLSHANPTTIVNPAACTQVLEHLQRHRTVSSSDAWPIALL